MHELWKSGEISFSKDLFAFPVTDNLKVGSCISVISRSTAATLQSGHAFLRPRYGRYLSNQGNLTDDPEATPHVLELLQDLAPRKSLSLQSDFLHPMMHFG
jgi:hypothetical protein